MRLLLVLNINLILSHRFSVVAQYWSNIAFDKGCLSLMHSAIITINMYWWKLDSLYYIVVADSMGSAVTSPT